MASCNNCDATVPVKKKMDGRIAEKQDRDCPECGKSLDEVGVTDRPHMI